MNHHAMRLRKGRFSQSGNFYSVTCNVINRVPIFEDFYNARILVNTIKNVDYIGDTKTIGFVVMPDHLHWLFELNSSKTLSEVVKQVKGKSSFLINRLQGRQGKLWQVGFYDRCLRKEDDLHSIMRYIVANPLRANIVTEIVNYPHWDCIYL